MRQLRVLFESSGIGACLHGVFFLERELVHARGLGGAHGHYIYGGRREGDATVVVSWGGAIVGKRSFYFWGPRNRGR